MISKEEAQTLTSIQAWKKTKRGYVKNLIIQSAMDGHTACQFDSIFTTEYEIKELEKLGYDIDHIQNETENSYRVYWE